MEKVDVTDPSFRREKQCAKCPWKVSTDPSTIPDGYTPEKHAKLTSCSGEGLSTIQRMHVMACHESKQGDQYACVGWIVNQLGPGNNIGLRLAVIRGRLDPSKLVLDGEQHETIYEMVATARNLK